MKLSDGKFYAGQTREIRERLDEHRDSKTKSTAGKDPKLVWFTTVNTRNEATKMEAEIKKDIDRNDRQIRRMIIRFRDLLKEVDLTA
ncbi:MAG: GIY-YIG nuclease family protein [Chloroflexi bacterium]|nr:GIY-YIG nuclease family protein [Chloroflexota bacterium]